jgi:hypothetical protein
MKRIAGKIARNLGTVGIVTTFAMALATPSVAAQMLAAPPVTPPDAVAPTPEVDLYPSFELFRDLASTAPAPASTSRWSRWSRWSHRSARAGASSVSRSTAGPATSSTRAAAQSARR